jgi:hypothetical protein
MIKLTASFFCLFFYSTPIISTYRLNFILKVLSICFIFYLISIFLPQPIKADMQLFVINRNSLNFDLGPMNYNNSHMNYNNSHINYDNSHLNYDNSYMNLNNGINGNKRLISTDNFYLGYYVFGKKGVTNFFSKNGKRIAYNPGGGHTSSIFFSEGGWCGTIAQQNRRLVLGVTKQCYLRFFQ